jgi:hypothetical protein
VSKKIRPLPCEACPYRRDVPSGVWAKHEYDKLREYDAPTQLQPYNTFACHASPQAVCNGWAIVHNSRGGPYELVGLRLWPAGPIPEPVVPLFSSGNEAADHGERDIDHPSPEAKEMVARLMVKHERLRDDAG